MAIFSLRFYERGRAIAAHRDGRIQWKRRQMHLIARYRMSKDNKHRLELQADHVSSPITVVVVHIAINDFVWNSFQ